MSRFAGRAMCAATPSQSIDGLRHDLLTGHRMELEALLGNAAPPRARDGRPDAVDGCGLRYPRAVGDSERAPVRGAEPVPAVVAGG